jgi:hypothetical protein
VADRLQVQESELGASPLLLAAGAHRTLSRWLQQDVERGADRAQWLQENHEAVQLALHAKEADALQRRLDVLREGIMRLRPALRNGEIEAAIDALEEMARG